MQSNLANETDKSASDPIVDRQAELRAELQRIDKGIAIRKAVINDLKTRKKAILKELKGK